MYTIVNRSFTIRKRALVVIKKAQGGGAGINKSVFSQ